MKNTKSNVKISTKKGATIYISVEATVFMARVKTRKNLYATGKI